MKSDKLPQAESLEALLTEYYKFENAKDLRAREATRLSQNKSWKN